MTFIHCQIKGGQPTYLRFDMVTALEDDGDSTVVFMVDGTSWTVAQPVRDLLDRLQEAILRVAGAQ